MGFTLKRRRFTAWIACLAMLLASLAPSISLALVASGSTGFIGEICTVAGIKTIKVNAGRPDTPVQQQLHLEHCPFCFTHADVIGLPPSTTSALPVFSNHPVFPSLFYQAPHPLFVWATAQSRAPPVLS